MSGMICNIQKAVMESEISIVPLSDSPGKIMESEVSVVPLSDSQGKIAKKVSFAKEDSIREIRCEEESKSFSSMGSAGWDSLRSFVKEQSRSVSSAIRRLGLDDGAAPSFSSHIFSHGSQNSSDTEDTSKGHITVFTKSGCAHCKSVRKILRQLNLRFVEINLDVYPLREKELYERAGSTAKVPQVFLNEKLLGGVVAVNSLYSSGELESRIRSAIATKCPKSAPEAPVYGFDDQETDVKDDELVGIVRVLRQKLPIQDRFYKFRYHSNCFSGANAVEVLIHELDCGRKKAVEMGKKIAKKKFLYSINDENEFEDGNCLYRFLEYDPAVVSTKCLNFQGFTNDEETQNATVLVEKLRKLMMAIYEAYVSENGFHVNYSGIQSSEEFRRYCKTAQGLQRINVLDLTEQQRLAFFINIYNFMVIHAVIRYGYPNGILERRQFFNESNYLIGGATYSLSQIHHGVLRANQRAPYALIKPFGVGDRRLQVALTKPNNMIHFALSNGSRSGPALRLYSSQYIDRELEQATKEFFHQDDIAIMKENSTVLLNPIFKWFGLDFGEDIQMLEWILRFLDEPLYTSLSNVLGKNQEINIMFKDYDWSLNT